MKTTYKGALAHLGETGVLARERWGGLLVAACRSGGQEHGEEEEKDEWEALVKHYVAAR